MCARRGQIARARARLAERGRGGPVKGLRGEDDAIAPVLISLDDDIPLLFCALEISFLLELQRGVCRFLDLLGELDNRLDACRIKMYRKISLTLHRVRETNQLFCQDCRLVLGFGFRCASKCRKCHSCSCRNAQKASSGHTLHTSCFDIRPRITHSHSLPKLSIKPVIGEANPRMNRKKPLLGERRAHSALTHGSETCFS
jgi:hypothetical protein